MSIEQIKANIDRLERELFFHSLQPIETVKLEQLQEKVIDIKRVFLENSFTATTIEELEEIRFKLVEIDLGVTIALKEQLHQDTSSMVIQLAELYKTA